MNSDFTPYPLCADTLTPHELLSALATRSGDEESALVVADAEAALAEAAGDGSLPIFAHRKGEALQYRVPAYVFADGGREWIAGALTALDPGVPRSFDGATLVINRPAAEKWLATQGGNRRGPKTIFDWEAFETYAVGRLWEEGGFSEGWLKAKLEEEMEQWCRTNWEREPGRTSIQNHVKLSHDRFRKEKATN